MSDASMETDPANEHSLPRLVRPRQMRSQLSTLLLMSAALGGLPPIPEPKPERKCLLAGCDVLTDHNGGYCCAEHHAEGKRPNVLDQRRGTSK
jgi:hypothetical protein